MTYKSGGASGWILSLIDYSKNDSGRLAKRMTRNHQMNLDLRVDIWKMGWLSTNYTTIILSDVAHPSDNHSSDTLEFRHGNLEETSLSVFVGACCSAYAKQGTWVCTTDETSSYQCPKKWEGENERQNSPMSHHPFETIKMFF